LMITDGVRYLSLAQATRPLRREWEEQAVRPTPFPLVSISATPVLGQHAHC
jgi:hypothetical protein